MNLSAREGFHAGALLTVAGSVAWVTGEPFIFPSLGPSAYVLATGRGTRATRPQRVLGGHIVGVIVGLAAYHSLASGVAVDSVPPSSVDGLRIAASGVLLVTFTTFGMSVTRTNHAPACATTLIISLGLLPTVRQGAIIVVAVGVLLVGHGVLLRLLPSVRDR